MNGIPQFDVSGRVALVTGAARGLGRAISLALANGGSSSTMPGGAPLILRKTSKRKISIGQ
jgi:hypothetical protein